MKPLTDVRRATARRRRSEQEWRKAIRRARAEGETLRAIAEAAGVTHPRVIQILRD